MASLIFSNTARLTSRTPSSLPIVFQHASRTQTTAPKGPSLSTGSTTSPPSSSSSASLFPPTSPSPYFPTDASSFSSVLPAGPLGQQLKRPASSLASHQSSPSSNPHASPDAISAQPSRFLGATVPYQAYGGVKPQRVDPLCEFWICLTMRHGLKMKATLDLQKVLTVISQRTQSPALPLFRNAIAAVSPFCRIKHVKKGAKSIPNPLPLNERQRTRQAIVWILAAAEKRSNKRNEDRLASEIIAVLDGTSPVLKTMEERHRQAMLNRANVPKVVAT